MATVARTTAIQRQLLLDGELPCCEGGVPLGRMSPGWRLMRSMVGGTSAITLAAMDHGPLCARPGCEGLTAAWLTYDYAGRRVWLDDAPSAGGDQWGLCSGHARRLRPPQGWVQLDRRSEEAARGGGSTSSLAS